MDHLMNTYKRLDIAFERGEGVYLWDTHGNRYLDALSGIAVCGLGHCHPVVTKTIQEQAAKLLHTSNLYHIPHQQELADILYRLTKMEQIFFCNSGAEAVEVALKLCRLYGHSRDIEFPKVAVMHGSFHGRTFATISASGNAKVQAGFEPLMPGFIQAIYNDMEELYRLADSNEDIVAVLLEPIQGEGGIRVPQPGYLKHVHDLCQEKGWLMVLDEVQTGMGRTGHLFAFQAEQCLPDILTVAKGLANGIPIGACLAQKHVGKLFQPGNHGSTFGGNPLACAAGVTTLLEIEKQKLWKNAKQQGDYLLKGLKATLGKNPHVVDIRGKGLMIGIELDRPCRDILPEALKRRLLFNVTNDTVMRLLPPLIIQQEHVEAILDIMPGLVEDFVG